MKNAVDDMDVESSIEYIDIVEERVERIPVLIKEGDDIVNAWHIPLLTTNGNMLFADIAGNGTGIVGIAWKTKSGKKAKVGWADATKEQLRFIFLLHV